MSGSKLFKLQGTATQPDLLTITAAISAQGCKSSVTMAMDGSKLVLEVTPGEEAECSECEVCRKLGIE